MNRKNIVYYLCAAVLSGGLGLSGCGNAGQVSQDTVVSEDETGEDGTAVPDETGEDGTAVPDETDVQNETIVLDETGVSDEITAIDDSELSDDTEDETGENEEQGAKVYDLIQQIEQTPIDEGEAESQGSPSVAYYDKDLDLVRRVTVYADHETDVQYEYLTDEAGNKVKGLNVLGYFFSGGGTDIHTEESLLTNERRHEYDLGYESRYEYDSENRLMRIIEDEGGVSFNVSYGEHTVEFTPTSEYSDNYDFVAYELGEDGHLLSYERVSEMQRRRDYEEYQYDEHGNRVLLRNQTFRDDGEDSEYTTVWEYEYDEEGRPFSIKEIYEEDMTKSVIISYDADGQVAEESFFWKDYEGENYERVRTYTYGEDGKLISTTVNGVTEWELDYEGSRLAAISCYDLTKQPDLDGVGIIYLNGLDFVSQYIEDYIGVELPGRSGYKYTIVYEGL